jgi:hypothetical protein
MKIIVRVLSVPFILAIHLIYANISVIRVMVRFVRYGGEFIIYDKEDRGSIDKIYKLLKDK